MSAITDLSKLCIHTLTTKPWSLRECVDGYTKAGVPGVSVWRQALEPQGVAESAKMLDDSGLAVVSLCRGGFFPAETAEGRQEALDDNRRAIDGAAAIGAPLVVLVCGAVPGMPLEEGRKQIQEGIAALLPHAEGAGVKLGIEPLHPVYSDSRSAVNTLAQANDMVAAISSPSVGVTIDVYHCWWDPALVSEIARAGDTIFSFHMCDWRTPTTDILNDRGLMGDGCINNGQIRQWVEAAGFDGFHEVEVFSDAYWATDQAAYVEKIKEAYRAHG